MKPEVLQLPDAASRELSALGTRHRQLTEMMTAVSNRRDLGSKSVCRLINSLLWSLKDQLAVVDREIREPISASETWRQKAELLESVPGVGKVTTATLLAGLPANSAAARSLRSLELRPSTAKVERGRASA
jgi:transposase